MATITKPGHISKDEYATDSLSDGYRTKEEKKAAKTAKADQRILTSAARNVKKSKYTRLNYMTIPQIKAAKGVLDNKIKECEDKKDYAMVNKLQDLKNEYINAERQLNKYYQRISTNPRTAYILRGKRDILTIATIRGGKFKEDKGMKYGATDLMRDVHADKVALGIGIAAMGAGALSFIPQDIWAKVGKFLLETFFKTAQGKTAFGLLISGASLIALSKVCPAIARTNRKIKNHKAVVNQAQNDLSDEASKEENNINMSTLNKADLNNESIEKAALAFIDNPDLARKALHFATTGRMPDGRVLTYQQKLNILKALKQAKDKQKELKEKQDEVLNPTKENAKPEKKEPEKKEPKKEEPKKEEPKKEEPEKEEPKKEEPKKEEPKKEEPEKEEPKKEEPKKEEPEKEEPEKEEPKKEEPEKKEPEKKEPKKKEPEKKTPKKKTPVPGVKKPKTSGSDEEGLEDNPDEIVQKPDDEEGKKPKKKKRAKSPNVVKAEQELFDLLGITPEVIIHLRDKSNGQFTSFDKVIAKVKNDPNLSEAEKTAMISKIEVLKQLLQTKQSDYNKDLKRDLSKETDGPSR